MTYVITLCLPPFFQDLPEPLRSRPDLLDREIVVPAESPTRVRVGPDSEPLILYPNKDNFHEIRLIGEGPAAFLDILSPPYNIETEEGGGTLEIPDDERRDCGFYQVANLQDSQGRSFCAVRLRVGLLLPDPHFEAFL